MGSSYVWNENPFKDFLFIMLNNDVDIGDDNIIDDIQEMFVDMLEKIYESDKYSDEFSFDIKKKNENHMIIGNNILSSLWLSGIFPDEPLYVRDKNEYIVGRTKFVFNKRTLKLSSQVYGN